MDGSLEESRWESWDVIVHLLWVDFLTLLGVCLFHKGCCRPLTSVCEANARAVRRIAEYGTASHTYLDSREVTPHKSK